MVFKQHAILLSHDHFDHAIWSLYGIVSNCS